MTIEDLENKAKQYSSKYARQYYHNDESSFTTSEEEVYKAYIACAKEMLKEMLKENEELRLKWLQATDEGTSWANLKSRENEIEELRQQIEKMKCCGNCKFQDVYGDCVLESPICCNKIYEGGSDEWELAE